MACYVVLIGGTGHRVGKAMVHLAASGCIPAAELRIMCVDSDGGNQDFILLKELIENYKKLCTANLFKTSITTRNDRIEELCWSPLSNLSDMKAILGKSFMEDNSGKKLMDFLYTDFEQDKQLTEGFYGHTSIGSLFMADQIMQSEGVLAPEWEAFLTDINDGDKIFVVGSAFGGTGASGVPTISRMLKEYRKNVDISAILVMPYFKFGYQNEGIIDYTVFTTKTKAAMSFYEKQGFDEIFKTLYIIGEDVDQFMTVNYSVGGSSQANVPNVIELCAATALIDFLNSCIKNPQDTQFKIKLMSREEGPEGLLVTQPMLNMAGEGKCFDHLAALLKFAVLYTKYFYHHLKTGKASGAWIDKYPNIEETNYEALYSYCMKFIAWMRCIHSQTGNEGELIYIPNKYVKLFNFSSAEYGHLFNGVPISKGFMGKENVKELDAISNLIYGREGGHRGQDIITNFNNESPVNVGSSFANFYRTLLNQCSENI